MDKSKQRKAAQQQGRKEMPGGGMLRLAPNLQAYMPLMPPTPAVAPEQRAPQPLADETHQNPYFFTSHVRFDPARIHAAAVYCSDGRLGEQIDELLQDALQLPRYDRLAIPGGAACLAGHLAAYFEQECVLKQLRFLMEAHNLRRVVLIAHQGCAYYGERLRTPPEKLEEQQRKDLNKAIQRVRALDETLHVDAFFAHLGEASVDFEKIRI